MDLIEAITTRRSVRAFIDEPVPEEVLTEMLEIARMAPSSFNQQSWELVVLTGKTLAALKEANARQMELGTAPHPDAGYRELTGKYRERQLAIMQRREAKAGTEEAVGKPVKRTVSNVSFHNAPAAVIVCADKAVLENRAFLEGGIISQNIALAAQHFGLGTCLMMAPVYYPEVCRELAAIPESKRLIIAIAVGYPDTANPASSRPHKYEPLSEFLTWRR